MPCSSALIDGLTALINGFAVPWPALGVTPTGFLGACHEAGVTGLVHQSLRRGQGGASWPEDVRAAIAFRDRGAAAEELLRRREIMSVLDALASAGITPILVKGTALAYSVYATPTSRPRADTDLLIRRGQVCAVREMMTNLGYLESANSGGERLFAQLQFWKQDTYGAQHVFDFHWKISTQSVFADVLTYDELIEDSIPIVKLGSHARAAGLVPALLLACIHPAMHHRNAEHLIWLYDIYLLASRFSDRDMARFVEVAALKKVGAVCAHELARARRRFAFSLAAKAMATLAACEGEPSAAYLRANRRWADELLSSLQGLPRWRDRLALLREIVFPNPGYMLAAYGMATRPSRTVILPALYAHRIFMGIQKIARGKK